MANIFTQNMRDNEDMVSDDQRVEKRKKSLRKILKIQNKYTLILYQY